MGVGDFQPWDQNGKASYNEDRSVITGTLSLAADTGLTLTKAEIIEGTFLVCTFEVAEDSPYREGRHGAD